MIEKIPCPDCDEEFTLKGLFNHRVRKHPKIQGYIITIRSALTALPQRKLEFMAQIVNWEEEDLIELPANAEDE